MGSHQDPRETIIDAGDEIGSHSLYHRSFVKAVNGALILPRMSMVKARNVKRLTGIAHVMCHRSSGANELSQAPPTDESDHRFVHLPNTEWQGTAMSVFHILGQTVVERCPSLGCPARGLVQPKAQQSLAARIGFVHVGKMVSLIAWPRMPPDEIGDIG